LSEKRRNKITTKINTPNRHKIMNFSSTIKSKRLIANSVGYPDKFNLTKMETSVNTYTMFSMLKPDDSPVVYKSKEEVKLNHRLLQSYFSFCTLDSFNKLFNFSKLHKMNENAKTYNKSISEKEGDREFDSDSIDYAKPIELTNEIHIYDRKKRSIIKKKVELNKKIHGMSSFLDGCRYVLHHDKLIITGGRDENIEYSIVLQYDLKDYSLTRLTDMNTSRSYHTLEYNTLINSLIAIGGENNETCEIYEIITNKWHRLPDLSQGRANIQLHFVNITTCLFTFFGKRNITTGYYSDIIEMLDFNDLEQGWVVIRFNNMSEMNMSNFCGVYPLFKDKLLMIGANLGRDRVRSSSVYCLKKHELRKIDSKLLEEIRVEAVRSPRISLLLARLSNKMS
jgi:hypothetical protein